MNEPNKSDLTGEGQRVEGLLRRALWHIFLRVNPCYFASCAYLLRYLPGEVLQKACQIIVDRYENGVSVPVTADNFPHIGNELHDVSLAALLKSSDEQSTLYGGKGYYRQYLSEVNALPDESRKKVHELFINLFHLAVSEAFEHDGSQLVEIIAEENGTRTC